MISEVSRRYARALYDLSKSRNVTDRVFSELRIFRQIYDADLGIREFLQNPLISPDQKLKVLDATLSGKVSTELMGLLKVLNEKHRMEIFTQVADAFEDINDEAHGVTRGVVRSAAPVTAEEQKRIEETVNRVTKKKVILRFEEDPSLLGGMVTQVGGWTFDDSLKTHLHQLSEELNRRAN